MTHQRAVCEEKGKCSRKCTARYIKAISHALFTALRCTARVPLFYSWKHSAKLDACRRKMLGMQFASHPVLCALHNNSMNRSGKWIPRLAARAEKIFSRSPRQERANVNLEVMSLSTGNFK